MPFYLNFSPRFRNRAISENEEGRALDSHIFLAVHILLDPDAELLTRIMVLVAGKDDGKVFLGLEIGVAFQTVFGHANNLHAQGFEFGQERREIDRFRRAAWRVVAWVEIDHVRSPFRCGQIDAFFIANWDGDIWCFVAFFWSVCHGISFMSGGT